ncbi:hypothetical protein VHUM_02902 [Vanrija humicola]|uniref:5'-Nucleotidase C-terminal domain-containing protein n=1 Tax=Vanrija humicola TaxID=5417 RepID=A0A7D8UYA7_VANHU|nr:hypothetical protein VHUM_02902 [Vanrija humicola]
MSVNIPLLAFNDVYRVRQRYVAQPGAPASDTPAPPEADISVGQFTELVYSLRDEWAAKPLSDEKEGLILFAGDVFSPSVDSSVTRGSHMVPVLNGLKLDAACVGNHDFDFGYPHMTKLVSATSFPWLLSNVVDTQTGKTPAPLHRFLVTEKCGVRIGIIGIVEEDWIATIPSWPENFKYQPMKDVAIELSQLLRDPEGEHRVDLIIALTHCRLPNDIWLSNELGAVAGKNVENEHGVDLIIGGHDHVYYIGKGAASWEGYVGNRGASGTQDDHGSHIIKSGTDFRDLSSAVLGLSAPNPNAIRRRTIASLTGKHHYVVPSSPTNVEMERLIDSLLASVQETLGKPVCFSLSPFDARSEIVRTRESSLGNWVADVLLHAYDESLVEGTPVEFEKEDENGSPPHDKPKPCGADAVIICGGTLRGDSQYGPGKITLGDILEIFPFDDPVVCLEIDGKGIWDTLESALSKWPAQEGRFPVVSGLAVDWDHTKPPGKRINSIHLTKHSHKHDDSENPDDYIDYESSLRGAAIEVKRPGLKLGAEIKNETGGRTYYVITRQYMADGFDGFEALKDRKFVIDDETGQSMSNIIRSFLLGSAYIFRHKQLADARHKYLSDKTHRVLKRARARLQSSPRASLASSPIKTFPGFHEENGLLASPGSSPGTVDLNMSVSSVSTISTTGWATLRRHVIDHDWLSISEAFHIARHEHMSSVDRCEGDELRRKRHGEVETPRAAIAPLDKRQKAELRSMDDDVAIVCPLIDGRLRDVSATADQQ